MNWTEPIGLPPKSSGAATPASSARRNGAAVPSSTSSWTPRSMGSPLTVQSSSQGWKAGNENLDSVRVALFQHSGFEHHCRSRTSSVGLVNDVTVPESAAAGAETEESRTDIDINDSHRVFICLVWEAKTLGVALFDPQTSNVHYAAIPEDGDFASVHNVRSHIFESFSPSGITYIVSMNASSLLMDALFHFTQQSVDDDEPAGASADVTSVLTNAVETVDIQGGKSFSVQRCRNRRLHLQVSAAPVIPSLEALMPDAPHSAMKAISACLDYVEGLQVFNDHVTGICGVHALLELPIPTYANVPASTLSYLNIFRQESHFSSGGWGKSKEGLSLFALLQVTVSAAGRSKLRQWLRSPLSCLQTLEQRQEGVAYFHDDASADLRDHLRRALRCMRDTKTLAGRVRSYTCTYGDFRSLLQMTEALLAMLQLFSEISLSGQDLPRVLHKWADESAQEDLSALCEAILKYIDISSSVDQHRVVILDGVDEELDSLKDKYERLPQFLTAVAAEEAQRLDLSPEQAALLHVVYFPQIGFFLTLPVVGGDFLRGDMELLFQTDHYTYYKTGTMRRCDVDVGDLASLICDKELEMKRICEGAIAKHLSHFLTVATAAAECDCLVAYAEVARSQHWIRPKLTNDSIVAIEGATHPLQVLCTDTYVRNSVEMGVGEAGRVHFLTGPNGSGKSVHMKAIGTIVYLAQVGSFVPAESANIGIRDAIISCGHTVECVLSGLSSFYRSVTNLRFALEKVTDRSLLLVDEFGQGTSSHDGLALQYGVLVYLSNFQALAPLTILSSHFPELVSDGLLQEDSILKFYHMKVMSSSEETVKESESQPWTDMTFLFCVTKGVAKDGFGLLAAKRAGIDAAVVTRAKSLQDAFQWEHGLSSLSMELENCQIKQWVQWLQESSPPAESHTANIAALFSEGNALLFPNLVTFLEHTNPE